MYNKTQFVILIEKGGISEQAVYKWERGACLPTIDNLLALSHLYDVRMEDLLVYEEVEKASFLFAQKNTPESGRCRETGVFSSVVCYACTAA